MAAIIRYALRTTLATIRPIHVTNTNTYKKGVRGSEKINF